MTSQIKTEHEKIALLLHEMIEGYGYDSCLNKAMMGIRPEHKYAEFVEHYYRKENQLQRCEFALTEAEFEIMQRINEFYRTFPIWGRFLGDVLYDIIREDPSIKVTEQLRDKVLDKVFIRDL